MFFFYAAATIHWSSSSSSAIAANARSLERGSSTATLHHRAGQSSAIIIRSYSIPRSRGRSSLSSNVNNDEMVPMPTNKSNSQQPAAAAGVAILIVHGPLPRRSGIRHIRRAPAIVVAMGTRLVGLERGIRIERVHSIVVSRDRGSDAHSCDGFTG